MDQPVPQQPQPTTDQQTPAQKTALLAGIFWMRDLFVSVLIAVIVILFLYQPVKVEGTSMMPMLIDAHSGSAQHCFITRTSTSTLQIVLEC